MDRLLKFHLLEVIIPNELQRLIKRNKTIRDSKTYNENLSNPLSGVDKKGFEMEIKYNDRVFDKLVEYKKELKEV